MSGTAFLFPGQGSQRVGMADDALTARPDVVEPYLKLAEEASGLPIRDLCHDGPLEELTRTEVAQPALFAISMAIHALATEAGIEADLVAGHSLGEYTAAVAAGCLTVEDGVRLVSERGRLMAAIQSDRPGAMGAIIGLPAEQVADLCRAATEHGSVAPANLNTPTQIVVSGEEAAVDRLIELAGAAGATRALRLKVGAAFHSELMEPVQSRLAETMAEMTWSDPRVPLVANAWGRPVETAEDVRRALITQIASPVLWVECVRTLVGAGCTRFLELGPGRVLSGLVRQIDSDVETFPADSPKKLAKFLEPADA